MSTRAAHEKLMDMQQQFLERNAKELKLPKYSSESLIQYILVGQPVGSFLDALLNNDLKGAVQKADDDNRKVIVQYVLFLTECAPYSCWGFSDATNQWIKRGGKYPQYRQVAQEESK